MDVPPPRDGNPSDRTYHRRHEREAAREAGSIPRRLLVAVAFTVVAAYTFVRWKPFRIEVSGPSMRPALEPGEWALAAPAYTFRRGDVVVVEHPERAGFEMVKRVVAVPGERRPDGGVLDADEYWVEGDSPTTSTDSRSFGPVGRERLKARVRLVFWPLERRRLVRRA
jgi:type IV secretory pathway protease TraF